VEIATQSRPGEPAAGVHDAGDPGVVVTTSQGPSVSGHPSETVGPGIDHEQRTRDRVCREVLGRGPVTAGELASLLGLTPAAVRRHLDVLLGQELVAVWEAPVQTRARGRGRPARRFVGTDAGHAALSSTYDDLAASALRYLTRVAGETAVRRFADERVAELEHRYRPVVDSAGQQPLGRAQALAAALSGDGYAASTRPLEVAGTQVGTQLCQGHCPVQHVAREFPQLCEAETEAFSRLLGVHVQRLATLAHGEHVCTTHVPVLSNLPGGPVTAGQAAVPSSAVPSSESTARSPEHPDHARQSTCRGDEEMTP
jgi:predicted ArsR family transcriptional regulator